MVQQTEEVWFNRQNRYGSTDRTGMFQQTEQVWFNRQKRYGSTDRTGVLLHLDQHFIERGPYRSGRERTLEIGGRGRNAGCVIYPMCCVSTNSTPGLYNQLSLLPGESRTRARGERDGHTPLNWPQDFEGGGLSARDCLRDSQAICSF